MSGKIPEDLELQDAYIKHYFMKRGVKPSEVDAMDANLVNNLMAYKRAEEDKIEFQKMVEESKRWQKT